MSVWKQVPAQEGKKTYYYNTVTLETRWTKPDGFDEPNTILSQSAKQTVPHLFQIFNDIDIELVVHVESQLIDPDYKLFITGEIPTRHNVCWYCSHVLQDILIYPFSLFEQIRLQKVVLVANLCFQGQKRRAVPNYFSGILYLDCTIQSVSYLVSTLHHELFHMIDYVICNQHPSTDEIWKFLNKTDFKYGTGGAQNRDSSMWTSTNTPGFLNNYSMTALIEDKAEIFAALILHSQGMLNHQDTIIQAKSKQLQKRLHKLCPEMNQQWWEVQSNTEKDNSTWKEIQHGGMKIWKNNRGEHSYRDPALFK
jgi:hypothetical protein